MFRDIIGIVGAKSGGGYSAVAPLVLPSSMAVYYSSIRPSTYAPLGKCYQVTIASTSATMDVYYGANNLVDFSPANTAATAAGSTWSITKLYDVSGNANDATLYGGGAPNLGCTVGGAPSITFDQSGGNGFVNSTLVISGTASLTRIVVGRFYYNLQCNWGNLGYPGYVGDYSGISLATGLNMEGIYNQTFGISSPAIVFERHTTTGSTFKQNGLPVTINSLGAASGTGFTFMAPGDVRGDFIGFGIALRDVSSAEETAFSTAIQASVPIIKPASQGVGLLALLGDSIHAGTWATGTSNETTTPAKLVAALPNVAFFNVCRPGETAADGATRAADLCRLTYQTAAIKNNLFEAYGTNDLALGATAAQVYASKKLIWQTARTQGFSKIASALPIVRNGLFTNGTTQASFEIQRSALAVLMLAGVGIDFDVYVPPGAILNDPAQCTPNNFIDYVHPNDTGCTIQSGNESPYIASMF